MQVKLPNAASIDLQIVPVRDLIPHEDTIPSLLDSVKQDIQRTGYQRDPIVIDRKTRLVLDGMHRRAALQLLSSQFALCVAFDYLDDEIILQRWLRYFIAPDRQMLDEIIDIFKLKRVENHEVAMQTVNSHNSSMALLSSRESYVGEKSWDLGTLYRRLSDFDKIAAIRGIKVDFCPDSDQNNLFLSESVFVLYPSPLSKQEIIALASGHRLLPFKTTRHLVPIRPMGIYFPLQLLKDEDLGACNSYLASLISNSSVKLVQPDSWYEGRQYSEVLAIFNGGLAPKN
jgi:hypothetical protein